MKHIDLITSLIPSLTPAEREDLKAQLSLTQHPCANGHEFRQIAKRGSGGFGRIGIIDLLFPATERVFCARCGLTQEVK